MMLIKLVDARKGLHEKCIELFHDEKVAESTYMYLCDGLEECDVIEPERKTGRWIGTEYDGYADGNPVYYEWKCSACGCVIEDDEPTWNFCPNCGADMRSEQNE